MQTLSSVLHSALTVNLMPGESTDEILFRRRGELQNETYVPSIFHNLINVCLV